MARIILMDDEQSLRDVVSFILEEAGHEVLCAEDGQAGLELFASKGADLVITDLRMPRRDGMEVLTQLKGEAERPPVPVIMLTAYGVVEQAVAAMKLGAFTYLVKPFNRDELRLTVAQALRTAALEDENRGLKATLRDGSRKLPFLYASEPMTALAELVQQVAASDATVLITGESGTGKELVARSLHDLSARAEADFVAVNCGAIPDNLVESQLFGHVRGAFTGADRDHAGRFQAADKGTLFLDEIGELPIDMQPKLLRVLETRHVEPLGGTGGRDVDFRLVCATNRDLSQAVGEGRFREDLLYRLNVIEVRVPPLRDRPDDILLLWDHFTQVHAGRALPIDEDLRKALLTQPWRGNVRELKNLNQRLVLMRKTDALTVADLEKALPGRTVASTGLWPGVLPPEGLSLPDLEKDVIQRALSLCGGNKSRTAAYLGIPRHVLIYRLEKFGL
jgi:two-component system, NtrC family, response regulator